MANTIVSEGDAAPEVKKVKAAAKPAKKKAAKKKAAKKRGKTHAPARPKVKALYTVVLDYAGTKVEAEAATVVEALTEIKKGLPIFLKARGVFTITKEGKTVTQMVNMFQFRRMFVNETVKQIIAKRFEYLLP